jgi:hypothetical protein
MASGEDDMEKRAQLEEGAWFSVMGSVSFGPLVTRVQLTNPGFDAATLVRLHVFVPVFGTWSSTSVIRLTFAYNGTFFTYPEWP